MVPVRHAPPALASQRTPVASPAVVVTVDAVRPGVWVVRSSGDRFGGTFVCPKAALKFAREEAARFPRALMVVIDGMFAVNKSAVRSLAAVAAEEFQPAA